MDGKSLNINKDNLTKLKSLFPNLVKENQLDLEQLKSVFGAKVFAPDQEHYGLNWAGKHEAFREIQRQITDTLIPDKKASINFDTTENVFIEGENLEVLKVLQRSYFGKIKMIYIDPPYNTGNDSFIYPDDYTETLAEYQQRTGEKDESGFVNKQMLFKKNTKENGQYHSVWLSMMYPRLYLARNLLREDGVIFVSIDDNEAGNLRLLLDEVFGEENFVAQFIWKSRQNKDNRNKTGVSIDHEYMLCYSRNTDEKAVRGNERKTEQYTNPDNDPKGKWVSANMAGLLSENLRPNCHYDLVNPETGINYGKPKMGWRYDKNTMFKLIEEKRIIWPPDKTGRPRRKVFLKELAEVFTGFSSIIGTDIYTRDGGKEIENLFEYKPFSFPKPVDLLKEIFEQVLNDNDIVLDFFAGSGTTAQAVLELNKEDGGNRKFILVQIPERCAEASEAFKAGYEHISDITQERIRRVIKKIKAEKESKLKLEKDIDLGFKSFVLSSSNFKIWRGDVRGEALIEQMKLHRNPVARNDETAMLYELLLKAGLSLSAKIETIEASGANIFNVENGRLVLALSKINQTIVDKALKIKPQTFVCLDALFDKNDKLKTNTKLQFRDEGIEFRSI
ncbi:adenine-specific DNA-methyltransferase [Candidatus Termititenax persephonae]|uniref:Adenine-specific DNA-methyltransferase n=1 Tax=Candidatus Termititenax persephonae TaxID=2218525 RepID=A0A388TI86_9BACT|nr:adenine-specific DNA-methyltransferase [Candidatus Termititenax persephonae]